MTALSCLAQGTHGWSEGPLRGPVHDAIIPGRNCLVAPRDKTRRAAVVHGPLDELRRRADRKPTGSKFSGHQVTKSSADQCQQDGELEGQSQNGQQHVVGQRVHFFPTPVGGETDFAFASSREYQCKVKQTKQEQCSCGTTG